MKTFHMQFMKQARLFHKAYAGMRTGFFQKRGMPVNNPLQNATDLNILGQT